MEVHLNKFQINIKITFPYQNDCDHHFEALKDWVTIVNYIQLYKNLSKQFHLIDTLHRIFKCLWQSLKALFSTLS